MTTQEIANRLVELCREGKNIQAIDELYADNVMSKEPKGHPFELTEGKETVKERTREWEQSVVEIHNAYISDPIITENHFAIVMDIDATYKERGRARLGEICVYEVKNEKIVYDEFFYKMG